MEGGSEGGREDKEETTAICRTVPENTPCACNCSRFTSRGISFKRSRVGVLLFA